MDSKKRLGSLSWLCIGLCLLAAGMIYRVDASYLPGFETVFSRFQSIHDFSGRAIGLADQGAQQRNTAFYMLGTSSVRHAFHDQNTMRQALASHTASTYLDLNTLGQRPLETFYLVTLTEPQPGDDYYYFVSPNTFTRTPEENVERLNGRRYHKNPAEFYQQQITPRFPELEKHLDPEHYSLPEFFAYLVNKSLRTASSHMLFSGQRAVYERHPNPQPSPLLEANKIWERTLEKKTKALAKTENLPLNIALIQALQTYVMERGATLHLLVAPHPQDMEGSDYNQRYNAILAAACNPTQFACTDLNPIAGLTREHFIDPVHANAAGREIWSRIFVEYLSSHTYNHEH